MNEDGLSAKEEAKKGYDSTVPSRSEDGYHDEKFVLNDDDKSVGAAIEIPESPQESMNGFDSIRKSPAAKSSGRSRPAKRRRTSLIDDASKTLSNALVESLLDRLTSVKKTAIVQRNKLLERAAELSDSVVAKHIAHHAAENVFPPPLDDSLRSLSQGVPMQGKRIQETLAKPATPAVAMLVKRDSLEKSVYAQNVIEKAKVINRRNAELARERLPKQPEAGRNKTHWDYFLDEALWLSQDLREERKFKLVQSRKLSKMVVQYHGLKAARARRATRTEEVRRVRIANGIARDVRKFWAQVRDIVNYKLTQIREQEDQKHKQKHLHALLEQTEEFSSALASHLQPVRSSDDGAQKDACESGDAATSDDDKEVDIEGSSGEDYSQTFSEEDIADEDELAALRGDADLPVAEVLRSQGVDTAVYAEDTRDYGNKEAGSKAQDSDLGEDSGNRETSPIGRSYLINILRGRENDQEKDTGNGAKAVGIEDSDSQEPKRMDSAEVTDRLKSVTQKFLQRSEQDVDDGRTADRERVREDLEVLEQKSSIEVPDRLLRAQLRNYQHAGLEWLAALYEKKLNGILADEMGLGKTVQTIALLAWLAVEKGIWGPHLIVVPTSVVLNWEVEFKKFLPGFRVLTYFGSIKERKAKRIGWTKPNTFHVCITSYTLVVQDATALKRKKWVYLILDEAQHIKNFQSQRWQTLLSFPSYRRLLLTGTPLQNSVMELWSLMHFLMPSIFSSHSEFKEWFSSPLNELVAGERQEQGSPDSSRVVSRLHSVLRPFLLRRLKKDVEKGLPPKSEYVVHCALSKRQRHLYEDFMARSETQKTLSSGDFISVMNVLMQLRKVCNHPDLFDGRPILSPFHMVPLSYPVPSLVVDILMKKPVEDLDISLLGLDLATMERDEWPGWWALRKMDEISGVSAILEEARSVRAWVVGGSRASPAAQAAARRVADTRRRILCHTAGVSELRLRKRGIYGYDLLAKCMVSPRTLIARVKGMRSRAGEGTLVIEKFGHCVRQVDTPSVKILYKGGHIRKMQEDADAAQFSSWTRGLTTLWRRAEIQSQISLPDTRLIQWDCGKLQLLDTLLRKLKARGSRVLIFTQMSKMLDILETFLNLHDHRYLRLDGSTRVDDRQKLMERFNQDSRVFCMILTTRSGGLGLNLTGADSVVFYDNDWNPAMDAQAQDRAHRIGQTKPVKIFRLVSSRTVEENILTKANQRRNLESLVISKAGFTTDSFRERINVRELVTPLEPSKPAMSKSPEPASSEVNYLQDQVEKSMLHQQNIEEPPKVASGVPTSPSLVQPKIPSGTYLPARTVSGIISGPEVVSTPSKGDHENQRLAVEGDLRTVDSGQPNVDETLQDALMDEEERAGLFRAKQEAEIAAAEFGEGQDNASTEKDEFQTQRNLLDYGLFRSLKPVELYALRLLEQSIVCESSEHEEGVTVDESLKREFTLDEMLERRRKEEELREQELLEAQIAGKGGFVETHGKVVMNGTKNRDIPHYELDCSDQGKASYLKALAGADVHVRIYIGLRDGGPEELKLSTVVNGTAASGLECAEDAAFFPHAYNRMTRTAHATRRQQEKYLAKMARRKAELVRRNARLSTNYSASTLLNGGVHLTGAYSGHRSNTALMNGYATGPPVKRARLDGTSGSYGSSDNLGRAGLFKRSSKKNSSRRSLMAPTRAASGTSSPLREIGVNDDWTIEQDQELLGFAAAYGNNMYVASDALRMHPGVAAGIRARKTPQQCASRMLNVLTPKGGTRGTVGKPPQRDLAIFNSRMNEIIRASRVIQRRRNLPQLTNFLHPSHIEVEEAFTKKGQSKFGPVPLQTGETTSKKHISGREPYDPMRIAPERRWFPFLRPQRDQRRVNGVRLGHTAISLKDGHAVSQGGLQQHGLSYTKRGVVAPRLPATNGAVPSTSTTRDARRDTVASNVPGGAIGTSTSMQPTNSAVGAAPVAAVSRPLAVAGGVHNRPIIGDGLVQGVNASTNRQARMHVAQRATGLAQAMSGTKTASPQQVVIAQQAAAAQKAAATAASAAQAAQVAAAKAASIGKQGGEARDAGRSTT